jgi:hypothetical protein
MLFQLQRSLFFNYQNQIMSWNFTPGILKRSKRFSTLLILLLSLNYLNGQMRITEYMYSGGNGEFIEFTNIGNTPIDMTGWSSDDNNRNPGVHDLSSFGIVQPGESVILTETNSGTFRTAWSLCPTIKIIGGYTNDNLGRSDEINLYDSDDILVDRLTYSDETLGGPRTQTRSAWVSAAGLGTNMSTQWTLSVVADAEGSFTSSANDIGSPGKSTRATVAFNPCTVISGAPTIVINVASTTNFLDGGIAASPLSPFAISGVINDPTDPAGFSGIDLTIGDDATPVGSLTVTFVSSNTTVVPNANVVLTGSGASRNVKVTPAAVGYSNITMTVNDGTNNTSYVLNYAASAAAAVTASTRWHTGISDASDALALDDDYYVTGDDEQNILNVYARANSGLPLKSFEYSSNLNLPEAGKEVDVEAVTRSTGIANRVYWLCSMSNGKEPFEDKPNRNRLFATTITGTGAATSFSFDGYYDNLRARLIAWGDANGYNFSASAAAGVDSKSPSGFAAEGLVFGPDNTTLYIGMRAPLVPTATRTKAVIAPILNFEAWFNNGSPAGNPVFGSPIELNLGGKGIRELLRLSNGTYVIVAGSAGESPVNAALYKWTGNAADAPVFVPSPTVSGLAIEGVMSVNVGGQLSTSKLQVISDLGGNHLYNDGTEAKDLGQNSFKKFRLDDVDGIDLSLTNQPPIVSIVSPLHNSIYQAGISITMNVNASDPEGHLVKVEFYEGANLIGVDSVAPYQITGNNVEAGTFALSAKAYDDAGLVADAGQVIITVTSCAGSGSIAGEGYTNITGAAVADLTNNPAYPGQPDVQTLLNKFEYGPDLGDNYGARVRGYICAPQTGDYIFYISGDDQCGLWLSPDDNPANKVLVAYVEGHSGYRSWFTYPTQKSVPIHLVKGATYYIESLHKQYLNGNHLSVAWKLPNGTFEGPIPGNRLSPVAIWITPGAPPAFEPAMRAANAAKGLEVIVSPNPSSAYFTINTRSNRNELLTITLVDVSGRVVEKRTQVNANTSIQVGNKLMPGIYFVEVVQGATRQRIKLVKQ